MELVYEVRSLSDGMNLYLAVTTLVLFLGTIMFALGMWSSKYITAGFVTILMGGFLYGLLCVIPYLSVKSENIVDAKREAISEVYDNVDYDGGRFMYGSRDGYYIKATVTDLEDNKILVQEFDIE